MHILDREGKNTLQYIESGICGDTYKRTIYNTDESPNAVAFLNGVMLCTQSYFTLMT